MARAIDNSADVIDLRDVTDRMEELEGIEGIIERHEDDDERRELMELTALLEDLCGNGGNHEWRGNWYPGALYRESYFTEYAQQLAEDIGAVAQNATWPNEFIDWDAAAEALKQDYVETDYNGVTYYGQ